MLVMSYDGAPFKGWQVQPNAPSVQESVENALRTLLRQPLHIVGAGRTDTEVNARHITAHFDLPEDMALARSLASLEGEPARGTYVTNATLTELKYRLNAILNPSVAVHHIVEVSVDTHARFDAVQRTYRYFLHTNPDPFLARRSRFLHRPPDFELMNIEARELIGTFDFTSFSKLHTETNNNICTVSAAEWHTYAEGHHYFEITANRFLRNMVRAVVGTLLEVGTGRSGAGHTRRVLEAMDRKAAGTSVPGYALYLWDIKYPYTLPLPTLPSNFNSLL